MSGLGMANALATPAMRWPLIRTLPAKTNLHFVGFARIAGILSVLAVIGSLALCFTEGLNLGIDFKGGTVLELSTTPRAVDLGVVRATLGRLHIGDVQVQAFGKAGDALVRFQTPAGADPSATVTRVKGALAQTVPGVRFSSTEVVGPKVSGELFRNGVLALGVAIALMLIYIWFRFELQFGLGAVAALFHDVILTFGLFALFRLEFTLTIIAAILTIIGYSMNDTVVVFDRLRENLRKYRRMPLREVIELSINETLSRTVITGLTALPGAGRPGDLRRGGAAQLLYRPDLRHRHRHLLVHLCGLADHPALGGQARRRGPDRQGGFSHGRQDDAGDAEALSRGAGPAARAVSLRQPPRHRHLWRGRLSRLGRAGRRLDPDPGRRGQGLARAGGRGPDAGRLRRGDRCGAGAGRDRAAGDRRPDRAGATCGARRHGRRRTRPGGHEHARSLPAVQCAGGGGPPHRRRLDRGLRWR